MVKVGLNQSVKLTLLCERLPFYGPATLVFWIGEAAVQACKDEIAVTHFARALVQGDIRGAKGISLLLSRSRLGPAGKWSDLIARELKKGGVEF